MLLQEGNRKLNSEVEQILEFALEVIQNTEQLNQGKYNNILIFLFYVYLSKIYISFIHMAKRRSGGCTSSTRRIHHEY